ncbi:hypothetical protein L6452_32638 [Arctium lappa]|uniref:Uncharacterized protein n=1 Tax=Arctium lappa TaxID=4217 RepID=A0ACB8Z9H0_ARCLA|nr:hypothetical protein L6452_32638 [Arctium lappa]
MVEVRNYSKLVRKSKNALSESFLSLLFFATKIYFSSKSVVCFNSFVLPADPMESQPPKQVSPLISSS